MLLLALKVLAGILVLAVLVVIVGYVLLVRRYAIPETRIDAGLPGSGAGVHRVDLTHDGRERFYLLYEPPQALVGAPLPLVLLLHGGGGSATRTDAVPGFIELAEREGFYVAMPQGVGKNWNDGRPDAGSKAATENVDDVGFVRAVLDDIAARVRVDARRVYATGISNGAMMSSRLACDAADRIAAIAPVAGTLSESFECAPSRPVPVVAFLGTRDPLVPYRGGEISSIGGLVNRGRVLSAHAYFELWAALNGCTANSQTVLPDLTTGDKSTVQRESFGGCRGGADVVLYTSRGGGHTWPGGEQYLSPWLVGHSNRDISATALIWRFFMDHPLPP
jgi:polyhydroxybutyrate depolymerase